MGKFFNNIETLEELKKEYRKQIMKHHPDNGGNATTCKQLIDEYEKIFKIVKNTHKTVDGEIYQKETDETVEQFIDLINELMKLENITIEIIGSFVWVGGETKPHKDQLKELKFRWSSNKSMWFKAPDDYKKKSRKKYEMEDLRNMYGTKGEIYTDGKKRIGA